MSQISPRTSFVSQPHSSYTYQVRKVLMSPKFFSSRRYLLRSFHKSSLQLSQIAICLSQLKPRYHLRCVSLQLAGYFFEFSELTCCLTVTKCFDVGSNTFDGFFLFRPGVEKVHFLYLHTTKERTELKNSKQQSNHDNPEQ